MSLTNKEKIVIIGYGWVGQANALALAMMGYDVFYYDVINPARHYKENYGEVYEKIKPLSHPLEQDHENTWYLISVGDRVKDDGVQDISLIEKASDLLKSVKGGVILRSTVLPKSLKKLKFDYYLPEFLHEKWAVEECSAPFYFVIGKNSKKTEPSFFQEWQNRAYKTFRGSPEQASHIKYLSNIWNALRIAFVNEYGDAVREIEGIESVQKIDKVMDFIFDKKNYLRYGKGYSGHCLPKDVLAFSNMPGVKNNSLLKAIHESNLAHQKLEKKHNLPEWFSGWATDDVFTGGRIGRLAAIWNQINLSAPVQLARKKLRFVTQITSYLIPDKSLPEIKSMWNDLAIKNARYFVNPQTKSGKDVNEFELRETGLADYKKHIAEDSFLKNKLGAFADKTALHIGCGIGRMTEFFSKDFKHIYGIDISETMLDSAKKRLLGINNITLQLTDGQSIAQPDNFFDFCFSYQTFQHFPTEAIVRGYFDDIFRTLKKEGVAKIQLRTGRGAYKWKYTYGVSLTQEQVQNMAESAGFTILKCEPEGKKFLWLTMVK